jgi:hypothetical protein
VRFCCAVLRGVAPGCAGLRDNTEGTETQRHGGQGGKELGTAVLAGGFVSQSWLRGRALAWFGRVWRALAPEEGSPDEG